MLRLCLGSLILPLAELGMHSERRHAFDSLGKCRASPSLDMDWQAVPCLCCTGLTISSLNLQ